MPSAGSAAGSGSEGPLWAPWHVLHHWSPFNIDALGLVTLLGAEEINAAVGRLVRSAYLEFLPLLGAYVIAGDRFTEKAAGWNLYNISQGIHTTDLAAWLTRWMLSQDFETTRNFVVWTVTPPRSRKFEITISFLIGLVANGFLVAMTILSADWYGFANALAMVISIAVRVYVIGQQRLAVDDMIDKAVTNFGPPEGNHYETRRYEYKEHKHKYIGRKNGGLRLRKADPPATKEDNSTHSDSSNAANGHTHTAPNAKIPPAPPKPDPKEWIAKNDVWTGKPIKVLIIQSDSKAVTFWMPNQLVIPPSLFIEGPIILNPKTYFIVRSIGWLAFAVHIIAIGMAMLSTQLYTVVLIVLPTLLIIKKTGCDDSEWMTTFRSWKHSLFHKNSDSSTPRTDQHNAEMADATKFRPIRHCWIGSRLKAEIYEWPKSYELQEEGEGDQKKWVGGGPPPGQERSKKRQDLYAWLALTRDEEESMDKWDLFPHIRGGNKSWWETYKKKKHALKDGRDAMGPQWVNEPPRQGAQTSQDDYPRPLNRRDRMNTRNFVDNIPESPVSPQQQTQRQSISAAGNSSAFPATNAPDEEDGAVSVPSAASVSPTVNSAQPASGSSTSAPDPGSAAAPAPPRVNTQSSTASSSHHDPAPAILSPSMTQSPTTMEATDDQP
ncbi:hypothetical protein H2200_001168 [Cladophialophora chaetospira]|uniref:Uncharacterized protein n=1 Tax=Cladophialophora chaetospira TaxID=386627 RepID=A0AA38XKD7_9EURO|nr:hypothetical protein H2200_001168 [Cladophialophora chaetospira]